MVHSVSGWTRGVQLKLWNPLRTRAIPERLRGAFTTRRYTNPRLPYLTLPYFVENYFRTITECSWNSTWPWIEWPWTAYWSPTRAISAAAELFVIVVVGLKKRTERRSERKSRCESGIRRRRKKERIENPQ